MKYLTGEFQEAKERYERVLQFTLLPMDQVHSIYIRLASIYLQEENVIILTFISKLKVFIFVSIFSSRMRKGYFYLHVNTLHRVCHGLALVYVVIE